MIASDQLGIPVEKITVVHGDTDRVPQGGGTMGSRSLQQGGAAVHQAAGELVELAKQRAADILEANVDDLQLADGTISVAGTGAGITLAQLAERERLVMETHFDGQMPSFPFGAHLAVVELDVESGKAVVDKIITIDDAGTILNPLLAEGQRHGGIAQGTAQALYEEVVYDADGNPLTATFADYGIPSAAELPSYTLLTMETPTHLNPIGAKGIGEAGTIGSTPAVQSAVCDAVSHLGIRHIDMPATPLRVWTAIHAAENGAAQNSSAQNGSNA
jgi:carbon-monoxide dehydrogenase large subunit